MAIEGVQITPLKIISVDKGNVMHGLKASEDSFVSFGEAYFSTVNKGARKGWKRHNRMVLNLVVPVGAIKFIIIDDRDATASQQKMELVLGPEVEYARLTVPPGLWMAFEGVGEGLNLLLNLASIPHEPQEADTLPLENDYLVY